MFNSNRATTTNNPSPSDLQLPSFMPTFTNYTLLGALCQIAGDVRQVIRQVIIDVWSKSQEIPLDNNLPTIPPRWSPAHPSYKHDMTWHDLYLHTYADPPPPPIRLIAKEGEKRESEIRILTRVLWLKHTSAKTGRQCTHALTWNVRSSPSHLILQKWGKQGKGNTRSSSHSEIGLRIIYPTSFSLPAGQEKRVLKKRKLFSVLFSFYKGCFASFIVLILPFLWGFVTGSTVTL